MVDVEEDDDDGGGVVVAAAFEVELVMLVGLLVEADGVVELGGIEELC